MIKRKTLALVISLSLLISTLQLAFLSVNAATLTTGTDIDGSYYIIANKADFDQFITDAVAGTGSATSVGALGIRYKLTDNIIYNGVLTQRIANFYGTLDGNGKNIVGMVCGDVASNALITTLGNGTDASKGIVKNINFISCIGSNNNKNAASIIVGTVKAYSVISNCYIDASSRIDAGLAATQYDASSLALYNEGIIENCYSAAYVRGGKNIGGFVSANKNGGKILNSVFAGVIELSTSAVANASSIGSFASINGAVGANSMIENCYSTGIIVSPIPLTANTTLIGGFVATNNFASGIKNSYFAGDIKIPVTNLSKTASFVGAFDSWTLVQDCFALSMNGAPFFYSTAKGTPLRNEIVTKEQLQSVDKLSNVAGGINYSYTTGNEAWVIDTYKNNYGFPILKWQSTKYNQNNVKWSEIFTQGMGTELDPFLIKTSQQYIDFLNEANKGAVTSGYYFKLTVDVNMTSISTPIYTFAGVLDGNNYAITNYNVNNTNSTSRVALIGGLTSNAILKNLTLDSTCYISQQEEIAGLVVINNGTIKNCFNKAPISANDSGSNAAGIALINTGIGLIEKCGNYARIAVGVLNASGISNVNSGLIKECFNLGEIAKNNGNSPKWGGGYAGIVQSNTVSGIVKDCYNRGKFTSLETSNVDTSAGQKELFGGLVSNNNGTVSNSYSAIPEITITMPNTHRVQGLLFGYCTTTSTVTNVYADSLNSYPLVGTNYPIVTGGSTSGAGTNSGTVGKTDSNFSQALKTDLAQFQTMSLVTDLGDGTITAFMSDFNATINGGYPILKWQAEFWQSNRLKYEGITTGALAAGSDITVSYRATNLTETDYTGSMIIAVHNKLENKIVALSCGDLVTINAPVIGVPVVKLINAGITLPSSLENCEIRVYLWNDSDTLIPLEGARILQ